MELTDDTPGARRRPYSHVGNEVPWRPWLRITNRIFYFLCQIFFRTYCPIRTEGLENLPPGPFLLCSNHSSHLDSVILMMGCRLPFRRYGLLAAKDYFFDHAIRNAFFSSLISTILPLDRSCRRSFRGESLALCRSFLEQRGGRCLIVFPEGTRSRNGEIQSFKRGVGLLSAELKLPLLPAWIDGAHLAMPKGRALPRPAKIQLRLGKPVYPEAFTDIETSTGNLERRLAAEAEKEVRRLAGQT